MPIQIKTEIQEFMIYLIVQLMSVSWTMKMMILKPTQVLKKKEELQEGRHPFQTPS